MITIRRMISLAVAVAAAASSVTETAVSRAGQRADGASGGQWSGEVGFDVESFADGGGLEGTRMTLVMVVVVGAGKSVVVSSRMGGWEGSHGLFSIISMKGRVFNDLFKIFSTTILFRC
mmetsp:Transcript_29016/g.57945  ORF Transcript_29016/g.57945 Transcript_29016/m.57945 type:complete len:119 (-) Transcript_29016:21-377(-)